MITSSNIMMNMIVATLCLGLTATVWAQSDIESTIATFDSAIVSVDKKFNHATTWDDLFRDAQFVKIYENPASYMEKAVAFISGSEYTDRQKRICICAMQLLSLSKYLAFAQQCHALYRRCNITEDLLMWTINPNFSTRYFFPRNYMNKDVKVILSAILRKGVSVPNAEVIGHILSGEQWRFLVSSGTAR